MEAEPLDEPLDEPPDQPVATGTLYEQPGADDGFVEEPLAADDEHALLDEPPLQQPFEEEEVDGDELLDEPMAPPPPQDEQWDGGSLGGGEWDVQHGEELLDQPLFPSAQDRGAEASEWGAGASAMQEPSLADRKEALLKMLAYDDLRETAMMDPMAAPDNEEEVDAVASVYDSTELYTGVRSDAQREQTAGDLRRAEEMLMAQRRTEEAREIRRMTQILSRGQARAPSRDGLGQPPAAEAGDGAVSSKNFLSFLQLQARNRSEDGLMSRIKTALYDDESPFDQSAQRVGTPELRAQISHKQRLANQQRGGQGSNGSQQNDDESMIASAELLDKYYAMVEHGEAAVHDETSAINMSQRRPADMNLTMTTLKETIKNTETGIGALCRPINGLSSVDRGFYAVIHLSGLPDLIGPSTKAEWDKQVAVYEKHGGLPKQKSSRADGAAHDDAPKKSGGDRSKSSNRSKAANKSKRGDKSLYSGTVQQTSPDVFLRQCMAAAQKSERPADGKRPHTVDPEKQKDVFRRFAKNGLSIHLADANGDSLLHMVARKLTLDVSFFMLCLECRADATAKNKSGETALHIAAQVGNTPVVECLLRINTDYAAAADTDSSPLVPVDSRDKWEQTPLHHAARAGHTELVETLLRLGADPDSESASQQPPLLLAAENNQFEAAIKLIEVGCAIGTSDNEESTALHKASKSGCLPLVGKLIEVGANINAKEEDGWTPLHWAANSGHFDVVCLLMDKGADVHASEEDGETPLHRAACGGHEDVVREVLNRVGQPMWDEILAHTDDTGKTVLHKAANAGSRQVTKLMLDRGAVCDAVDNYGHTPLQLAAAHGHAPSAVMLIEEYDADVNAEDAHGHTALHWAVNGKQDKFTRMLLQHGSQVNYEDKEGWTPLHWASKRNLTSAATILLESGGDGSWKDLKGMAPIHRAVVNGFEPFLTLLLKHGVDVESKDCRGRSPLNRAVSNKKYACRDILISNGADINSVDSWGHTPLIRAVCCGDAETTDLLCQIGAEIELADIEGRTALLWAAKRCDVVIMQVLLGHGANLKARDDAAQSAALLCTQSGECTKALRTAAEMAQNRSTL